ncbi:MAG TPA: sugar phosphate isomerase/epimerase family protein [Planctomycetota bacterium]|nr:sugar phosphate isomerase/epimerase family protein [Planctomycetota bacterium]HRR81810.1 sugar phosphate isomerase/epimerase family protein [Planctomycetota bacterium]HRT96693.1 sugar phosphate isomerase/epimerase family protein [Planctomycetota bacterium]
MAAFRLGVLIDCFRLGVRGGIQKAAEMGFDGIQAYVTGGELAPENLPRSARREFRKFVADRGLELSALCVELGGYADPATLDERIGRTRRMVDLGLDLGVAVHTSHIGRVPAEPDAPARRTIAEALLAIGTYAAERGACLACETGPEDATALRQFLSGLHCEGLKVNFDPANLVMNGFDPVRGVHELAGLIVHTHAKDGVRRPDKTKAEAPLGEGQVPWEAYLAALSDVGYAGYLTIEREAGDDPVADILKAKQFLEEQCRQGYVCRSRLA